MPLTRSAFLWMHVSKSSVLRTPVQPCAHGPNLLSEAWGMLCAADAAAAQWDSTPAQGFDAAVPPATAEGADWGAPAAGFEAAPAPAPFPDGAQQYQVPHSLCHQRDRI